MSKVTFYWELGEQTLTQNQINEALDMAIKALEAEDVLDKIRAEIDEQYDRVHPYNISCAEGLEMALEIIDKYRAESEEV